MRLDAQNGQAYQGLARALWVGKGDFAGAIPIFERAIELNGGSIRHPSGVDAILAFPRVWMGDPEPAITISGWPTITSATSVRSRRPSASPAGVGRRRLTCPSGCCPTAGP